jgi:hypothetical protein
VKHILDPEFKYTPALKTDIQKTFARVRRELAAKQQQQGQKSEQRSRLPLEVAEAMMN